MSNKDIKKRNISYKKWALNGDAKKQEKVACPEREK